MDALEPLSDAHDRAAASDSPLSPDGDVGSVAAWEEIETGRYMPRRIRGSCIGRALG